MEVTLICNANDKVREKLIDLQQEVNFPVLLITAIDTVPRKYVKEAKALMNKYAASEPFVLIEDNNVVRAVYKEEYQNLKQFSDKFIAKFKEVKSLSEHK